MKKIGYVYEDNTLSTRYPLFQDGNSFYWMKTNKKNSLIISSKYQNLKEMIHVTLQPYGIRVDAPSGSNDVTCVDGICKRK